VFFVTADDKGLTEATYVTADYKEKNSGDRRRNSLILRVLRLGHH
jgi:hypothetical protein